MTLPLVTRSLLLTLAVFTGQANAHSDAERDAAVTARAYQRQVQRSFHLCATAFAGRGGELFVVTDAFWLNAHRPTADAASLVLHDETAREPSSPDVPLPFMRAFDTSDAATKRSWCESLIEKQRKGELAYERVDPERAQTLKTVFGTERAWRIAHRNADFSTGCMKRHWNSGRRQVDEIQAVCDCQTAVMLRAASDDELDAFVRAMGASSGQEKPSLDNTPWLRTAAPLVAACANKP